MAADVWALGQVIYQLLCCPSQPTYLTIQADDQGQVVSAEGNFYWENQLEQEWKALIINMVLPYPELRPTTESVL